MDGRILWENLKRLGLSENWLNEELLSLGYKNAKEVFLCLCNNEQKLTVF